MKQFALFSILFLTGCFNDTNDLRVYVENVQANTDKNIEPITAATVFEHFDYSAQKLRSPFDASQAEAIQEKPVAEASISSEKIETTSDNHLYVNIDRRLIKIEIPSIYLIEAKGDYINVKTEDKNYTVHSTLKKIEEKLPQDLFLKVHRSYIINIKKIIDIEDNSVLIKKDVIPVSRSNRPELMKRLNLL